MKLSVENTKIRFKLNSGSEVNIIPEILFQKINRHFKVRETKDVFGFYGGFKVKPKVGNPPNTEVSSKDTLIRNNSDIFTGLERFPYKYKIGAKETAKPKSYPP
ncbi:hypothetical protein PR048_010278 [Dryococelus australis]|uniref:Uncharacterized protein n=1 Tax=Dryococelus australis TaxID=614101 RepID=A0ABQ9I3E2_9NEOP|nr:hypothetical protein PR048_010278 [Dryococelus australis]